MIKEIKTVVKETESKIEMKKSVFIAHLIPITSEDDAKEKIERIKKEYKDATHNVPAYRTVDASSNMIIEKCSDDGEPQGTSGKPILDLLKHKDLLNVLIVVTRYFGGTLLGTGGLVKAYTDSAKNVLEEADTVTLKLKDHYKIKCDYESFNKIKKRFEDLNFDIENITYNIDIDFDLYLLEDDNNVSCFNDIISEYNDNVIVKKLDAVYK